MYNTLNSITRQTNINKLKSNNMKHLLLIIMMLPMLLFGQSKIRNTQITSGNASAKKVLTSDGDTNAIWDSVHVSGLVGDVPLFTKTDSTSQIVANVEYGALYNWYAATDSRKITSSDDWVVPTSSSYITLRNYLGGQSIAGGKLKESGLIHWITPNTGATNEVNFNGRGTGERGSISGLFSGLKNYTYFITTTPYDANNYYTANLDYQGASFMVESGPRPNKTGSPIRLLYTGSGTPTTYTGNDGKVYPVVVIGGQRWINCNLNETKFRNGDWINGYNGGVYTPISNASWAALTTAGMCYYDDLESNGGNAVTQFNTVAVNLGDTIYVPRIDHLVPYRGSVDSLVTTYPIKATQFIADTTYVSDGLEQSGALFWDNDNSTLSYQIPDGGTIQVNQEPFDLYHNLEGGTIINGDIVSTCGASGNRTAVCLTDATNDTKSLAAFGMVTVPSILNNNVGRITKSGGKVRQLNTIAYAEGTVLYVDPLNKGKWTATMPAAPNRAIKIGTVAVSHAVNGVVELDIQVLPKMTELADVNGTPLNASGQIPVWDNTNKYFDFTDNINNYKHVNYCPTNLTVNTGVLNQGTVADLCAIGGTDVIVQENNGADPLRVTLSFSNVERLTSFVFYGRYSGGATHVVNMEAYNYTTASWQLIGELGTNATKQWYSWNIFLPTNYISAGVVQVRFNHQGNGINTHQLILDYVDVNYGGGGGSSFQTASEIANIPYSTTGSTNVQAAINELTDEKIQKVTSTDNAVVRYDGTTGAVQNSGVTVDDSNNVGIATTPVTIGGHSGILTVYGSNATAIVLKDAAGEGHARWNDGILNFTTSGGSSRMAVDFTNNKVGFGFSTPLYGVDARSGQRFSTSSALQTTLSDAFTNPTTIFDNTNNLTVGLRIGNTVGYVPYIQGASSTTNAMNMLINPFGGKVIVGTTLDNGVDIAQFNGSINSTGYRKDATALLLDAHKSGSLGTSGYLYVGQGATTTPAWQTVNQAIGGNALAANRLVKWDGSKFVNITDGTNGQFLKTDGTGNYSFSTVLSNGTDNFIPKYSSNSLNQSILNVTGSENLLISTYKGANSDGYNIYVGGGGQSSIGVVGEAYKGSKNTTIGYNAGYSLTTGFENNYFGYEAGYYTTSGHSNAYQGQYSGQFNTEGYYNTAVGHSSGKYTAANAQNETSNNSVYIGYNSRSSANGNTNEIVIGATAAGNGSNTATIGNSSVTTTYLSRVIVLRPSTSAPSGIESGIYYNSTDKHFYGYDGTTWKQLDN